MKETIMQCCYTNSVQEAGGKISSGWQPVDVSEHIPSDAYNNCVSLQNANSTIQSHMVDEQGNVLNLYEIVGDGSYVYVIRTQYGLTDRLGRPNMFSHAYIFSWKQEDILGDPNIFLTIEKCNFADNEDAAKTAKTKLSRTMPFTIEQALESAGLEESTYLTLIQCVYSQYSERKTTQPLYIQYNGSEEQMRAILYCIYYGLPHYVRKNLSVASAAANTAESKNIIFSEYADKHEFYLIPQTGENNLLTQRTERKIARYGFVDYAARNYASIDVKQYFEQLDKTAIELGDSAASNELILKIAHQMMEKKQPRDFSQEELDSRLSDALRSKTYGSLLMENYISDMLDEVCSRKMFLTEENEANLADRLAVPVTDRLAKSGEQYNIYRFSTLSPAEAAKLLSHMEASAFRRYSQTLAKSSEGLKILDDYYSEYAMQGCEITWESLTSLLAETNYMSKRVKTIDWIDTRAWELYDSLIEKKGRAVSAFRALMVLMCKLYGKENQEQYEQSAKEAYWEKKSLEDFSYDEIKEYRELRMKTSTYKMFFELHAMLDDLIHEGEDSFLSRFNGFCIKYESQIAKYQTTTVLHIVEREIQALCKMPAYLPKWMKIAAITGEKELFEEILKIKNALYKQDYDTMISVYQETRHVSKFSENSTKLMKLLSSTMVSECSAMDQEENFVPLDVWILLGAGQYENSFELFDELSPTPYIFRDNESSDIVLQSKFLTSLPYSSQAEEYAKSKGAEAKTVRKWLNEAKVMEKRKRAEEKRMGKSLAGRKGFSQSNEDKENESREESEQSGKKGFFKDLFGRKS